VRMENSRMLGQGVPPAGDLAPHRRESLMRAAYVAIVGLGFSCVSLTLWMFTNPHWYCIILAALSFVGLAISLVVTEVVGFRRWRRASRYWMVPGLICFAFVVAAWFAPSVGRSLADRQFSKHLSEFTGSVKEIRSGASSSEGLTGSSFTIVDVKYAPDHVRAVKVARCDDGDVVAAFLMDTDVPLLHEGYVYKGYAQTSGCNNKVGAIEDNWPYVRRVSGNWYHFSDEPGL